MFYLGESVEVPDGFGGPAQESSLNVWELGVEAGYDLALGDSVVVRPELGLGGDRGGPGGRSREGQRASVRPQGDRA